jgi:hypothetical protein
MKDFIIDFLETSFSFAKLFFGIAVAVISMYGIVLSFSCGNIIVGVVSTVTFFVGLFICTKL